MGKSFARDTLMFKALSELAPQEVLALHGARLDSSFWPLLRLLNCTDTTMRAVLLLLASTAARRRGGPPPLRRKNKGTGLTGGGPARRLRHQSRGRITGARDRCATKAGAVLTSPAAVHHRRRRLPQRSAPSAGLRRVAGERDDEDADARPRAGYLRARQVPGDGACLFHTLSAGLWESVNGTHHPMDRKVLRSQSLRLRARAIDVLEDRRDPKLYMGDSEYMKASQLLEMAAEQAACAKDEYCAKLRDPRAWGGGPEIVALSNALSRPIHIYESSSGPRPTRPARARI